MYGAEAAAQYHFGIPAARVNREQGARLAAILPSPLRRKTRAHERVQRTHSRAHGQDGMVKGSTFQSAGIVPLLAALEHLEPLRRTLAQQVIDERFHATVFEANMP